MRIEIPPALRAAWAPFAIAALILPTTAGFLIGGPGPGLALGALTAFALLWIAGRRAPAGMIETQAATDSRRRILLVIGREIDDPQILETAARAAGISFDSDVVIRVVSPTRSSVLDRWAGDFRRGQAEAQRRLVVTVASLATAGVEADARVGDVDLVQAVEDQLRSFAATDVVLVTGSDAEDPEAAVGSAGARTAPAPAVHANCRVTRANAALEHVEADVRELPVARRWICGIEVLGKPEAALAVEQACAGLGRKR